jgi:alpha,alpha-trehalase
MSERPRAGDVVRGAGDASEAGPPATDAGTPTGGRFAPAGRPRTDFPPIASYAFLSDREVHALVAPDGAVEWLCVPRPDSPSVFTAILDRAAGSFRVGPPDESVPAGRRYVPGTNVLETTWQVATGWLVVTDALLIAPWYQDERLDGAYARPPGQHQAEHILLRLFECVNGHVDVEVSCSPSFEYGSHPPRWEYPGTSYGEVRTHGREAHPVLRLTSDMRIGFEGREAITYRTMRDGEQSFVALAWGDPAHEAPRAVEDAVERLRVTEDYWRDWLNRGWFPDHPWRTFLQRSALTLKGLTYAPTGALIAAPTTSLPERLGGERNWDYRYSWIRDSTFALWGLYTLGFESEARNFYQFIRDRLRDRERLQIMYRVDGEPRLDESELEHLSGYEGSRPVRIGNAAYDQDQHDVWGSFLDSVYIHHKAGRFMDPDEWEDIQAQVETAVTHWREPDRGLWEVRGDAQHFTSSKIMSWVACDRGALLAEAMDHDELSKRWRAEADAIHADVLANGIDERGVLVQRYGDDALDASLLLAALFRFLPPDDDRVRATVLAIADELTIDGLVLRYRTEETDDGLSGDEGTFAICSFWLVSALVEIGEVERGRALVEKMLTHASPLGLYAEELDAKSGRHLGNFPQAFTHLALINAVMHVIRAESPSEESNAVG